ncbi:MAG TPA: ketol-acid reductoisomerase [Phycisphaerales bacterium]|nr:ketol-acid reductoisomerase [Phycisphaerales bacterium]
MAVHVLQGSQLFSIAPLKGKTIAILGYGNQGQAHAQNLRDSGLHVVVGSRPDGKSGAQARRDGFQTLTIAEASHAGDLVIVGLPDQVQGEIYRQEIAPALRSGSTLGFLHGYSIRYKLVNPQPGIGIVMVAPKGPGRTLRERFLEGRGLPALLAVEQESGTNDARTMALAWAGGIGCGRAVVFETTMSDETETDLFGEQAVLCGGMTYLIEAAFETLVNAGYPPELAYIEVCHEMKQIADLVFTHGLAGMMRHISTTAEIGAHIAGPKLITGETREHLAGILRSIRDGNFAREAQADAHAHHSWLQSRRDRLSATTIETIGATLRPLLLPSTPPNSP